MSVRERLEDGHMLYQSQRPQGALLSVLVAVAATSRKRRPLPEKDSVAFTQFLGEEMLAVTEGGVQNFSVRFRGEQIALEEFFYKFVRCELAHEARLPADVRFVKGRESPGWSVQVTESYIALSESWMAGLSKVVQFAPENAPDFPDVAETPDDVVKWLLFGKRRESRHVPEYWAARTKFAEAWTKRHSGPEAPA